MTTTERTLDFLSEFDQNIMAEIVREFNEGAITAKQGMHRLEVVRSRAGEKHSKELLQAVPRPIVAAVWSDMAKFGQMFGAGIRLRETAAEVLRETE
jgi:hypothetical protein